MRQRLLENQRLAQKNTKTRCYLLRGLIQCASCGSSYVGVTITRREKKYSYYVCGKRWKPGPNRQKCESSTLVAEALENAVFASVVNFLRSPEGFESEMQRRKGITAETELSLRRELESLQRRQEEERDAEARAFRLAARVDLNEDVFGQEIGLIRTKQRWIEEQSKRLQDQLDDVERYTFTPEAIALLRRRLDTRLAAATPEDRRFVLEAVGTKGFVQIDGSWDLELQIPRHTQESEDALQIVNSRPEWNCTVHHI